MPNRAIACNFLQEESPDIKRQGTAGELFNSGGYYIK